MYEFAPGPGIKVSRIAGLSDDLSMALQALSIRIVAPIPGQGVVGIETPQPGAGDGLRSRRSSPARSSTEGRLKLPLALGKDIFGAPLVTDLARMPHLLVAGATGIGQVGLHQHHDPLPPLHAPTPHDVRIIMVDPKMLELSIYEGIPHLLLPVVTNPEEGRPGPEMGGATRWGGATGSWPTRGCATSTPTTGSWSGRRRSLPSTAAKSLSSSDEPDTLADDEQPAIQAFLDKEGDLEHGHLPYIVVIVDELADLMMVAGREIEESIARLAQMARAAGIHLILATQRPIGRCHHRPDQGQLPGPHLVPGLLQDRFAHHPRLQWGRVAARRRRHALPAPRNRPGCSGVHGAFVSDAEVQRVVEFLKKQGKPVYDKSILEDESRRREGGAVTTTSSTSAMTMPSPSSPRPARPPSP